MTCVIWKYPLFYLSGTDSSRQRMTHMSADAKIIHAAIWDAEVPGAEPSERVVCVWVETNPHVSQRYRTFELRFTGDALPAGRAHVATLPDHDTGLVWHLYEVTENA